MRWLVAVAVVVVAGCTKPNPSASCADGKCTNPAYPYCDVDGAIGGTPNECIAVICTPGAFGACDGSDAALYCNATGDGYDPMPCMFGCDASTNTCHTSCERNDQCASGVCKVDGTCAMDSEVTWTAPNGSPASDCSKTAPCTLEHATSLTPPVGGQYIRLTSGAYVNATTIVVSGKRVLVGDGTSSTTVTSQDLGPIFSLDAYSDVIFEAFTVASARGIPRTGGTERGVGIECPNTPAGPRTLKVVEMKLRDCENGALAAQACEATLLRSYFSGGYGVAINGTTTIDACTFTGGSMYGLFIAGQFSVTNSFMIRSAAGIVEENLGTSVLDFNTVADNDYGVSCQGYAIESSNNILARNRVSIDDQGAGPCTFPGSIVATDIANLRFVSPDNPPYDYHVLAGSSAIDSALVTATLDHDYDGDARPKGAARDVGADEAE